MSFTRLASIASLVAVLGMPLASQAQDNSRALEDMIAKECQAQAGMVTKAAFMKAVERRFDKLDAQKKGMISTKDAARLIAGDMKIWSPNF